jgi:hypothetical protein
MDSNLTERLEEGTGWIVNRIPGETGGTEVVSNGEPEQRNPQQKVTTPHTAQLIRCTTVAKRNADSGHKTHKIRRNMAKFDFPGTCYKHGDAGNCHSRKTGPEST